MRNHKLTAAIATVTLLAVGFSSPVFAKAHNNGVDTNERDIGHISGREGSANTYLRDEVPTAKNIGEVVSGSVKSDNAKKN